MPPRGAQPGAAGDGARRRQRAHQGGRGRSVARVVQPGGAEGDFLRARAGPGGKCHTVTVGRSDIERAERPSLGSRRCRRRHGVRGRYGECVVAWWMARRSACGDDDETGHETTKRRLFRHRRRRRRHWGIGCAAKFRVRRLFVVPPRLLTMSTAPAPPPPADGGLAAAGARGGRRPGRRRELRHGGCGQQGRGDAASGRAGGAAEA